MQLEMVLIIVSACIAEAYIAKMIYKISGKATYDDNKRKLHKACITGLQFIAIMVAIMAMCVAALLSGYIN